MAGSEHGDSFGFFLRSWECHLPGNIHARLGWTGRTTVSLEYRSVISFLPRMLNHRPRVHHGCTIALLSGYGCELKWAIGSLQSQS